MLFIVNWKLTIVGFQPMSFDFPTRVENYQAGFWKEIIPNSIEKSPCNIVGPISNPTWISHFKCVFRLVPYLLLQATWPMTMVSKVFFCTLCLFKLKRHKVQKTLENFNVNLGFIWVHLVQIVLSKLINIWISNSIAPIVNHIFIQSALHKVLNYMFLLRPDWSNCCFFQIL